MVAINSTRFQHGQAMIEYAIILILVVMMIVGGVELARTSFASSKVSDAAKAAANELAEVHEKNAFGIYKLKELQRAYLIQLDAQFSLRKIQPSGGTEIGASAADSEDVDITASPPVYRDYLDFMLNHDVNGDATLDPNDYDQLLANLSTVLPGVTPVTMPLDAAAVVTLKDQVQTLPNSENKYKALIVLRQLEIIDNAPVLADHEDPAITQANCGVGNTYDYGLPDRYPAGDHVYLFHPLPVNTIDCVGEDVTRGNQSRISILIGGYGQPGDADYVQGLPKLNQAMYSLYNKVCLDATNQYIGCDKPHTQALLKPPGKICLTNTASTDVDSCGAEGPQIPLTGYYFWGQNNESAEGSFSYENDDALTLRPTFQLVCNAETYLSPENTNDSCTTNDGLQKVQIHTRYRAIFEGFLTFGLQELNVNYLDVLPYFYNPGRTGTDNQIGGIVDAEIGPIGSNRRPTVKQFKDFRGCYEVDMETNQISACN